MKYKIAVVIAFAAIIITTFKTGYAFYEKQTQSLVKESNEVTKEVSYTDKEKDTPIYVNSSSPNKVYSDFSEEAAQDETSVINETNDEVYVYDESEDENFIGGCCGSGAIGMLDENGNFKEPEVYEKELEAAVKNGEISEEEKDYYLENYKQCIEFFSDRSENSGEATN